MPLVFTYQTGQAGVTASSFAGPPGSSNNLRAGHHDFNGDGKEDIVYWNGSWFVAFGANNGFAGPYNSTATASNIYIDKFLPQGRAAIVAVVSGQLWFYRWNDATSSFVASNTGVNSAAPTTTIDYNGDGLADLLYYTNGATSISVRPNTSTGSANPSFSSSAFSTAQLGANLIYGGFANPGTGGFHSDINGDGREDVSVLIVTTGMGGGFTYTTLLYGSYAGFDVPPQAQWEGGTPPYGTTLNFNGDKCADRRISTVGIRVSACSGNTAIGVTMPATPGILMDWDGDGKTDLLVNNGGTFGFYRSTGAGYSGLTTTSVPWVAGAVVDQDGDHLDDLIQANGTSAINFFTHTASGQVPATYATNVPDLLATVSDGYGVTNTPNYVSTAWRNYDNGAVTSYPLQESTPRMVVAMISSSDGNGGTYSKNYFYVGARTNVERGDVLGPIGARAYSEGGQFAGFQRVDETDNRNGIVTRTYFEQTFPLSGMASQVEVLQPNGVTPISRTVFTNTFAVLESGTYNQRYAPYAQASTATRYEVGGTWNGSLLSTVTTINVLEPTSGTIYDKTVTTTEPVSGANGLTAGGSWVERTYTPLANLLNDTTNWCLGRRVKVQQINSHTLAYGTAATRTADFGWDGPNCRLTQIVQEPGNSKLQAVTAIGYDSFGNVNSSTVTGIGMSARTTTSVYSNGAFTTGQFPLSTTNALNQTSTSTWNYDLGVPLSSTDPNGISISWEYDLFGRRKRENLPDGTFKRWTYATCSGCDSRARMVVTRDFYASGGTLQNSTVNYLDLFDRSIYEYLPRADNYSNVTSRNFDSLGRVVNEYFPYSNASAPIGYSTISYDLLGRPTAISRPKSDADSTLQTTTFVYDGLSMSVRDANNKATYKIFSASGAVRRLTDHDYNSKEFDYDAFGNPRRIIDQNNNVLQSSSYNLRGMLTQRTDMDMGAWNFTPNALGQVVSQTDAKSQNVTLAFDLLGRLTGRTEAEGTSTWKWGDSSASKNIGQLEWVQGSDGYKETYAYDSIGRPRTTTILADVSYQIDYSYNNIGALDTLTYPQSTSSYRLKVQYEYLRGQLRGIKDFNAPSTVFWTSNAINARDQLTQETLGNGLVANRAFDSVSGTLKSIQTGLGGGTSVQNLTYEWGSVGNLRKRKDLNQSNLTEEFFYDNLYRLDYSQLNGITNLDLSYDGLGNIVSKSDVGSYTYHATKRHQVTSTSNGWSFGYDLNGNMTSGRGATINWTSYNLPSSIGIPPLLLTPS